MNRIKIQTKLKEAQERRQLYLGREAEMLDGGVQSYGIGNRSAARYATDLANIRSAIKELEIEIDELEALLDGGTRRRAYGGVPME